MNENLILVNEHDQQYGTAEKLEVHRQGMLHRAFSILIYNNQGEMLLQQRADGKYHSAGKWGNACCGHPQDGEALDKAAHRRLYEELGFDTVLNPVVSLIYKAELERGMVEHEYVHLLRGVYEGKIYPNIQEVQAIKWVDLENLKKDMRMHPDHYAKWFMIYATKYWPQISAP